LDFNPISFPIRFSNWRSQVIKPVKYTSYQKKILQIINVKPGISDKEIAAILGKSRQAVNYHTKHLSDIGMISSKRKNKKSLWYIRD